MDPSALEQDGFKFAKTAVELDTKGALPEAIFYYKEATEALRQAAVAGSKLNCAEKADEYMKRVEELVKLEKINQTCSVKTSSAADMGEQRAKFLIKQALEEDEQNNQNEALELYMQGAELCLKTMNAPDISAESKRQFESLAKLALSRGEIIKAESSISDKLDALPSVSQDIISPSSSKTNLVPKKATNTGRSKSPNLPKKPLGPDFSINENNKNVSRITPTSGGHPRPSHFVSSGEGGGGGGDYTKEEIAVLRSTSFINRREYVPFMSVDLKERFGFPVPFTDKDGMLELSAKQKKRLGNWARPSDFASEPQMILAISSFSIKQTVVSDCSFVASIAISAAYERKYRKKLITSIIYPQNKKGEPMYNPCGKYMVKLHLNGVSRKVIIDDYLPVDRHGELLCSYSSNRNELWVSLIEKAYMKVMGGYDFPGSNSNIDLHALTGWIPERQSLRDDSFDKERFFDKIYDRFHRGHCLATISTGVMTEQEESRTGLVATHAYAVLDIQKVQGIRMLQLKNPWSHLRWKGRYSVEDDQSWTPALRKALKYDVELAKQYDNGVFWIDYESALHFYDTFYVSWNPALFPKTTCQHASWFAQEGPVKDAYSIGNSPQYCLEVKNVQDSVIWVLLTRHITEKDDFAQNKEFITLVVYKNEGKKVYYPHSPPPYIDGIRINSPHYLTRIKVPGNKTAPNKFTLVVSQYEKHKNISYTLRVYSVSDFNFRKIVDPYKFKKRINGEWNKQNSGGCANHRDTYKNNPSYQINLMEAHSVTEILIELRAPRQYSVGFDLICVQTKTGEKPPSFNSGNFRSGYSMMEFSVPPGIFNIIPCTFSPQQLGSFFLDISSSFESSNVAKVR